MCVADVQEWADGLEEIRELIGPRFARAEPHHNAVGYLKGLLSAEERKNSWTLSERAGQAIPDRMQRLLSTTDWDPDGLRDDLRSYVVDHLGSADGVLIVDETGFLKKGTRSAGVARQYCGTAGRVENCQIGVFLTYATPAGRTFLDRELYLPKAWTDDRDRCASAGIPATRKFATKPELAITMITRALDAGVPAQWVTGDAVYGQHAKLRETLHGRGVSYVLAVPMNQRVIAKTGALGVEFRADGLIASLSGRAAYYICHAPLRISLAELARVAGARWAIEETFQTSKDETGLDHYQVRQWKGWHRHITLSMLAHAFLTVTRSKKGALRGAAASS
ncbi:IS701 family transposase [Pseudarthrobacter sp. S9]|uniref:IS701 family transposase n=1 Tax=Pseudarthrobacter sp. S9 TaxID=3418421 RepID=UPI003D06BC40